MCVRTTRKTITFTRPFSFGAIDKMQPAGTYTVETDEELLQDLSFPAYRRVATVILLPQQPGSAILGEAVAIDPAELEAAQEWDVIRR